MQSSINKMRFKTGGHLSGDAYSDVQYINRRYSPFNVLVNLNEVDTPASFKSFLAGIPQPRFVSRATIPSALAQNSTTELDTGIPVYVNTLRIPEANAFDTIFFFFLAFIAIALVFHAILFLVIAMVDRFRNGKSGTWATRLRRMWWDFCAGNALRIASPALSIVSAMLTTCPVSHMVPSRLDLWVLAIPDWRFWSIHLLCCLCNTSHSCAPRHCFCSFPTSLSKTFVHCPNNIPTVHFVSMVPFSWGLVPRLPSTIPLLLVCPTCPRDDCQSGIYRIRQSESLGTGHWKHCCRSHRPGRSASLSSAQG